MAKEDGHAEQITRNRRQEYEWGAQLNDKKKGQRWLSIDFVLMKKKNMRIQESNRAHNNQRIELTGYGHNPSWLNFVSPSSDHYFIVCECTSLACVPHNSRTHRKITATLEIIATKDKLRAQCSSEATVAQDFNCSFCFDIWMYKGDIQTPLQALWRLW